MSSQSKSAHHAAAGRIGAYALHASHDPRITTAPGRAAAATALDLKLLQEIDAAEPNLPEAERERRLGYARRAHFARLAMKAAKARKKRQRPGEQDAEGDDA